MPSLCAYTLLALAAEVVLRPEGQIRLVLNCADTAICVAFLFDFFQCVYRAPNRLRYLSWGWLDLLSSIPTVNIARWVRAARLARLIRVLRGVRATKILGNLVLSKRAESAFLAVALVAILLLVAASISILEVETGDASNIKTANDAIWWALTTITTVGYGDRYPVTPEGRLIAGVLMCAGVGLFGMFSGFLAAWFVVPAAKEGRSELELLKEEVHQLRAVLEKAVEQGQR